MEFKDIPILQDVIPLNHLAVIFLFPPDSGELQFSVKIFMNLGGKIEDGASFGQYDRIIEVGGFPRRFGVRPDPIQSKKNFFPHLLEIQVFLGGDTKTGIHFGKLSEKVPAFFLGFLSVRFVADEGSSLIRPTDFGSLGFFFF
jgi:hypothetical protein